MTAKMTWEKRFQSMMLGLPMMGRDALLLLLWALASAVIVVIAVGLSWQTANHLLRQELRTAALDWATYLVDNVNDLEQVVTTGAISRDSRQVLHAAGRFGGVFRYELFDLKGSSVYASDGHRHAYPDGETGAGPSDAPSLHDILAAKHPIVRLNEQERGVRGAEDSPRYYGEIHLPLVTKRGLLGMAEIHVDRTDKATYYHHEFVTFATGLTLLILFAMALPMVMVWRKTKQRELAERQLHDMAHTDPLTRLSNRTNFRERLLTALRETYNGRRMIALLWLDLDRFKTINDALGHPIGDSLLCQVAHRLRRTIPPKDTVARLGGDEFAVVLTDCREQRHAAELAEKLIKSLSVPFDIDGHHVVIGVSIGIVFAPFDGEQVDDLLKKADIALYRAKDAGRSTYRCFKPDMEARSEVRHVLEEDLRIAINTNQLRLHYQPQICLDRRADHRFRGLAALASSALWAYAAG